ncbi:hypothetical protein ACT4US_35820, partial [Bacillus sp. HC-Mk]
MHIPMKKMLLISLLSVLGSAGAMAAEQSEAFFSSGYALFFSLEPDFSLYAKIERVGFTTTGIATRTDCAGTPVVATIECIRNAFIPFRIGREETQLRAAIPVVVKPTRSILAYRLKSGSK